MAEERLIDTDLDKDKKYKITLNADGEEELVVEGDGDEGQTEVDEVMFAVEDATEDDEDAVGLTPEQLAEKRAREEKERKARAEKVESLLKKAKSECLLYRYATALEHIADVEALDDENGEAQALKLIAYTRGFTDYSQITSVTDSLDDFRNFVPEERKEELLKTAAPSIESAVATMRANITKMNAENEKAKAERAVKFKKDRNIALIVFSCILCALGVFGALTGYFATIIYTVSTGVYLKVTIVFAVLSFIALIALAFSARRLNITARRVRKNKRNTSTQLGRDLLAEQARLKALMAVHSALKGE